MRRLSRTLTRPLYALYERRLVHLLDREALPRHIGVIHDGHRRFARTEHLADYRAGYQAGMEKFEEFLTWCHDLQIPAVTCWLLSTENLKRPPAELDPYYDVLGGLFRRLPLLAEEQAMEVRFIGSLDLLPRPLLAAAKDLEESCSSGQQRLTIALAYGGRQEIVDATRDLVGDLAEKGHTATSAAAAITAAGIAEHLYTADLPDPDLVLRTSGESRLSGFLLWQAAYAEYSFIDVYWPAFRRVDFLRALREFTHRERRFGR